MPDHTLRKSFLCVPSGLALGLLLTLTSAAAQLPQGWSQYQCESDGKVVARSNMPLPGCTSGPKSKTAKNRRLEGKSATQTVSFDKAGQVEILLTEYRRERAQLEKLESTRANIDSVLPVKSAAFEEEKQRVRADLKALRNELARLGIPDPDPPLMNTTQRLPL